MTPLTRARLLAAGILALSVAAAAEIPPAGAAPATAPLEFRLRVVEQINRDRAAAGLRPVEFSPELSRAADEHCREMAAEGYTSHWNRAGLKPYVRYSRAGLQDYTAENIWSHRGRDLLASRDDVLQDMLAGHRQFMAETPPLDGHRRNILTPQHTHVGIGVAFTRDQMRMIQVFGSRRAELDPLPAEAALRSALVVRGRVSVRGLRLHSISVFYEPPPQPMSLAELAATYDYALPDEEWVERPVPPGGGLYADGSRGTVVTEADGSFRVPLTFWKGAPGIYTVAVWVRAGRDDAVIGAMASVIVYDEKTAGGFLPLPGASAAGGPAPGAWPGLRPAGGAARRRGD